ncbi:MAG: ABC transporter permease subunit [Treponema sp.]|nr:ABC transporter permease subunit [Treponema sp.]
MATRLLPRTSQVSGHYFQRTWMLYLMLLLPIIYFIVFKYIPMAYVIIAFKDYNIFTNVWDAPWAGFKHFVRAIELPGFFPSVRNTLMLNVLDLILGFPAPIILALLLNELINQRFKKFTQTIIYLPHFLSWIIIAGMARELFAMGGVVNLALERMNMEPINFLMDKFNWVGTYIGLGIWKEMGWGTIIYLAAITGINPELYEAAEVDGAGRWQKLWHITLPGIKPTVVVLLIMNLGRLLGSEFDRPWTMRNGSVLDFAEVISTLVYDRGILSQQFSLTAAIGLFQSIICVVLLIAANTIAKRSGERGIY